MKNHITPEEKEAIKDAPWKEAGKLVGTFPEDFMNDRNQPSPEEVEKREKL